MGAVENSRIGHEKLLVARSNKGDEVIYRRVQFLLKE